MHASRSPEISYGSLNYKGKTCDYCYFNGQTKETCDKLIGYPNDWKQKRREGYNGNSRGYGGINNHAY